VQNPVHCQTFASSTPPTGRITRNFIDIIIIALVDYFRSVVRLASARLPKNPKSNLSFWRLPCPPIAPRTVPLCVRSPLPMAASAAFPAASAPSLPLRVPCPQVVVVGLQTRQLLLPNGTERSLTNPFRINTCKSVSKQSTLTSFRINTCEKHRGEGVSGPCGNSFGRARPQPRHNRQQIKQGFGLPAAGGRLRAWL
jgi:hypothetical protein